MPVVRHQTVKFIMSCWNRGSNFILLPQSVGPNGTKALVNSLSKKFSVILFDQLGTGRSVANSDKYGPSISDRMTEISCLLDHLDIEASHLFCHSTGCGLGISWASSQPPA